MNDIDFERRLEEALAGYADRPVEPGRPGGGSASGGGKRRLGRARRLVTVTAAGAVAVTAVAVPYALRPGGGERSLQAGWQRARLAITARIGIPGPRPRAR